GPVPRVVETRLPFRHEGSVAELSEPAGRAFEHDGEPVFARLEVRCEIDGFGNERSAKAVDLRAIDQETAGIVEPEAAKLYLFSGCGPSGWNVCFKDPVAVFDPLAVARVESMIPIGKNPGVAERGLDRTGNFGLEGWDLGVRGSADFHAF